MRKQYTVSRSNSVKRKFVADIISTDAGMGLFYIDTPDGPELIAAIKLGVGDVIEGEGEYFPTFDKVRIESTVEGNYEYVTPEQLVERFNNIRKSLQWHINAYTRKVQEVQELTNRLRTQARVIQNLSDINKQLEDHNGLIKDPAPGVIFDAWVESKQPPQTQVTHGDANNQEQAAQQVPGAQSRFELDQECENFFKDEF